MQTIPDKIYVEAMVDEAMNTLYNRDITPEQYKEYFESRFGKDYAYGAMMDARDMELEIDLGEPNEQV